jgi:hypothetical protein
MPQVTAASLLIGGRTQIASANRVYMAAAATGTQDQYLAQIYATIGVQPVIINGIPTITLNGTTWWIGGYEPPPGWDTTNDGYWAGGAPGGTNQ